MEREMKTLEPSELSKKLADDRERELNQKLQKAKQALLGMQTVNPKEPVREEVPRFRGGRYSKPIETALKALGEEQAAEGMRSRKYEETPTELETQEKIFCDVGDILLGKSEGRTFLLDDRNRPIIRLLIAYLNRWKSIFTTYSTQLTGTEGDLFQPLMLMGEKGVGKTLLMQVAAKFCDVMKLHGSDFINTSSSELLNCMRVNGNLDFFTYNTGKTQIKAGNPYTAKPWNVCLHDLGIELDAKQNIYGTSMNAVVADFLMARYELYQNCGLMCHITTNLSMSDIYAKYPPRVVERFKQYNYIIMQGESRR